MAHKTVTISEEAYEALVELKKFEKATIEARRAGTDFSRYSGLINLLR